MTNIINADTDKLRSYAKRIDLQKDNIRIINNKLNFIKLDIKTSIEEKEKAYKVGSLNKYRENLGQCSSYLKAAADEIENVENALAKMDALNFQNMQAKIFLTSVLSNIGISSWIALSNIEKEQIWNAIEKIIGKVDKDLKMKFDSITSVMEYFDDPNKILEDGYGFFVDNLEEYLGKSLSGNHLSVRIDMIGLDAFINMAERFPGVLMNAQGIIEGKDLTDYKVWMEYGLYLGEHVVVDGILETSSDIVNSALKDGCDFLGYFGIEIDITLDDVYESVFNVKGIEGYKKGMSDLVNVLADSASETYYKDAENVFDYIGGTIDIAKDGVSIYTGWAKSLLNL